MIRFPHLAFLSILILGIVNQTCLAQDTGVVDRVRALYQDLRYDEAEQRATQAIDQADVYDVDELAELHALLALIHYVQQNESRARAEFLTALSLKPDLTLDPILVPPRAITFFDTLREEAARQWPPPDSQSRRYILMSDPRPGAAMRSALIPGWGQHYKGERTKGWVVAGLFAGSLTGALIARAGDGNDDPQPGVPVVADSDSPLLADVLIATTAGIWLYSYLDALLSETSIRKRVPNQLQLYAAPTTDGVSFGGTLHF